MSVCVHGCGGPAARSDESLTNVQERSLLVAWDRFGERCIAPGFAFAAFREMARVVALGDEKELLVLGLVFAARRVLRTERCWFRRPGMPAAPLPCLPCPTLAIYTHNAEGVPVRVDVGRSGRGWGLPATLCCYCIVVTVVCRRFLSPLYAALCCYRLQVHRPQEGRQEVQVECVENELTRVCAYLGRSVFSSCHRTSFLALVLRPTPRGNYAT